MRWYSRVFVLLIAGGALATLFSVASLYSPRDNMPTLRPMFHDMSLLENKLLMLQKKMSSQYKEMTGLLSTVNKIMKTEKTAKESDVEKEIAGGNAMQEPPSLTVLPVLVIACNRVTVKRCLENLIRFRPDKTAFPIIVSQDCGHSETTKLIRSIVDKDPSMTLVQQPDLSEIPLPRGKVKYRGYYKIARHFKFALNHVFRTLGHEAVIIVEDDLDVSPDFFEYFKGTYPLLLRDPSLWCISAWNDNGRRDSIDLSRPELLHRTDFFPGLGWLLRRESWLELDPKWPPAFFDDWLRNPKNTNGRSCIRPEISRTYTFGKVGVSQGQFFDMHLRHMHLNQQYVQFSQLNLTYLLKDNYEAALDEQLAQATPLTADDVIALPPGAGGAGAEGGAVKVLYKDARSYQKAAKKLGLMDDFRSGIPRTAYRGVVVCYVHGRRVLLAPGFPWRGYDPKWG